MKTQLLNFWHKIKDWLLVLPAFCFFDLILESLILPRTLHTFNFLHALLSLICWGNKTLMTIFMVLLLISSFVSMFTYKSWFLKYNAFIFTLTWILWACYALGPAYG
jgi:hypothetical protein